jgi:hypothetical protein
MRSAQTGYPEDTVNTITRTAATLVAALMLALVALPAAADVPARTSQERNIESAMTAELDRFRADPSAYGYNVPPMPSAKVTDDLTEHARWLADARADGKVQGAHQLEDHRDICCANNVDAFGMGLHDGAYEALGARYWVETLAEIREELALDRSMDHVSFGVAIRKGGDSIFVYAVFRDHDGSPLPDDKPRDPATPDDGACPSSHVRDAGFTDVTAYRDEINCLAGWDITHGVGDGTRYDPSGSVTRGQMASFLVRAIENSGGSLPAARNAFSDVSGPHAEAINRLAAAGVAGGYPDGTYRPGATITRAQMATFLARSYEHRTGHDLPDAPSSGLSDIGGSPHEARIDQAVAQGWAQGYNDGTYAPGSSVRRDHMALFITRWLDTLADKHGVAFPG